MQETVPRSMLRKNAKIELLKRVPLFADCSKRELRAIAEAVDEVDVPADTLLTKEGATGREFVVIVEGAAGRLLTVEPNREGPRARKGDRVCVRFRGRHSCPAVG